MATIDATVGGANANSYCTHAEANTYFDSRMPLTPAWVTSGQEAVIITACRMLDTQFQPLKTFVDATPPYYRVRRAWTGRPATTTQRLAWPRIGMFDANGNAIADNVIPLALKEAQSELAGQLKAGSATVETDTSSTANIKSVKAGSVSVTFKDDATQQQVAVTTIPDTVLSLMPPSWFTDELYIPASSAEFDVIEGA